MSPNSVSGSSAQIKCSKMAQYKFLGVQIWGGPNECLNSVSGSSAQIKCSKMVQYKFLGGANLRGFCLLGKQSGVQKARGQSDQLYTNFPNYR